MDELRPSFRYGDRRLEIVSGKSFGATNQMYTTSRTHSPLDLPPFPSRVTLPSQSSASAKPWGFTDPEMKRRKRIARYKVYTMEGRVKASIRNGLRWIKNKCSEMVHGF
ncbi:DUF3511 domain protein, putative [Actinidia rufa]|uniref:DUF3511 domain protein, putative n=1 Tax=Actinidia rufa TaxID=165716 RepID=A0A7J0G199_9ERIC|nr:DUF3511 domain protein, putative [Actinidia rufa]